MTLEEEIILQEVEAYLINSMLALKRSIRTSRILLNVRNSLLLVRIDQVGQNLPRQRFKII